MKVIYILIILTFSFFLFFNCAEKNEETTKVTVKNAGNLASIDNIDLSNTPLKITAHPGGNYLFCFYKDLSSNRTIQSYSIDKNDGRLIAINTSSIFSYSTDNCSLSLDGKFFFVFTDYSSDTINQSTINQANGQIGTYSQITDVNTGVPIKVITSNDLKHAYYIKDNDIIKWYNYSSSGIGSKISEYTDTAIANPNDLAITKDDNYVFVTSGNLKSIAWFSRNSTNGNLTYVNSYINDILEGANSVTLSPDGKFAYVTAITTKTIAVFEITDYSLTKLTYLDKYTDDKIQGISGLVISPDGKNIYAVSESLDSIIAFTRDTNNGKISYLNQYSDPATDGVSSITITPDGKFIYTTSKNSKKINMFKRI